MRDQAYQLRNLAFQAARQRQALEGPAPRLVVLSGGKGGVGATTLAVNLAVALGVRGARVVLVDAGLYRADVAALCGLTEQSSVADVLNGNCDIHEVLQRGPGGILVVPGLWAPGVMADYSEAAQQRLIRQFLTLGRHADLVLIDVGGSPSAVTRRFFQAADLAILATTPDAVSVMDTYATIKTLLADHSSCSIQVVVNQASCKTAARDVHLRIDRSCQRFLGMAVDFLGWAPVDPKLLDQRVPPPRVPHVLERPDSPLAKSVMKMAAKLSRQCESPTSKERQAA